MGEVTNVEDLEGLRNTGDGMQHMKFPDNQ